MKKRIMTVLVTMAMVLSALPMLGSAAEISQPEIPDPVTGITDMLGGGGYVHIELGNNSDFGVIYGTETNPNSIVIVTKVSKYVGYVEAYDSDGAQLGERNLRVGMLFAQKLDTLLEFNDTNQNGICDYTGALPGALWAHEPVYKKVSLNTSWERSEITKTVDGDNTTWSFTLTAHNLRYIPLENQTDDGQIANETLDTLQFTFHLRASRVYVDNGTMPHFRLTMEMRRGLMGKERYRVTNMERNMENVSGWKSVYGVKYDQRIEGWDFDPTNTNPALLLVFHSVFAHHVPVTEAMWIRDAMRDMGANGTARYYTDSGEEQINDTNAFEAQTTGFRARQLRHRFIEVDDTWERVARFAWVSNVTVDGQEMQMHAQIQGAVRHTLVARGQIFTGFGVVGGLTYPAGEQIFHDPEVSGEAFTDIVSLESQAGSVLLPGQVVLVAIATVAIIGLIGTASYLSSKKKNNEFEDLAETALPDEEE